MVQLGEDPALFEHPQEAFRNLPSEDGLHPWVVGFVLVSGERDNARADVLDGHWGVYQRADGVGQGEQISGGHPSECFRAAGPDIVL